MEDFEKEIKELKSLKHKNMVLVTWKMGDLFF